MDDAEKLLNLKRQYEKALAEGSFEDMVAHGEAYFISLRNGALTPEDKEQLQNDILRINEQKQK